MFFQRLAVSQRHDKDVDRARLWLVEELRKHEPAALLGSRRWVQTDTTRTVDASAVLVSGGTATYFLDVFDIISNDNVALLTGYGLSLVLYYFGSRILLRRRPLLPRQLALRLTVLRVLTRFLASSLKEPIDETVDSARAAVARLQRYYVWDASLVIDPDQLEHRTELVEKRGPPLALVREDVAHLRREVMRLTNIANEVHDNLVMADLIRLEGLLSGKPNAARLLQEFDRLLESLSQ